MAGGSIGGLVGGILTDSYMVRCSFSGNVSGENQVGEVPLDIDQFDKNLSIILYPTVVEHSFYIQTETRFDQYKIMEFLVSWLPKEK